MLWLISLGWLAPVSVICAIIGIVYGRKGKRRVEAGETDRHRGLAQAASILGIITIVVSILAAAGWTTLIVLAD